MSADESSAPQPPKLSVALCVHNEAEQLAVICLSGPIMNTERTVALSLGVRPSGRYASAGNISNALDTARLSSAMIGKSGFAPPTFSISFFQLR